ncbi:MAG: aminotransferase class V-fold PLP-dependent enzyme [Planctomycetota bacterium]|nr:aminotransferase class V-fold PLP-dependent enzyme [Planctomycetota bacterium]
MEFIYLDHNATTKPAEEVVAAMIEALREGWANPSSMHRPGQAVRRQVELARESVCDLIGCRDRELVFTSGGTEAANLAIGGSLAAQSQRNVLVTSRLEHSTVREPAETLERRGTDVVWLANDGNGIIDLDALRRLLAPRADEIALVSIMWANNETGIIQPIEEVGRLCREHGVRFHTDATQWVGKMPTDVSSMPVDMLSFSAHKFHGPKGIGALYVRSGVRIEPQLIGGPQERERRGGTENVPGIIGLGVAARLAKRWLAGDDRRRLGTLRDSLEQRILGAVGEATVIGGDAPRLWSTSNIAFAKLEAEAILLMLSERGVCASAGAACSSGSMEPSTVLLAMGIPDQLVVGSIRFSLSRDTTADEIDRALEVIVPVIGSLRATMAAV